MSVVSLAACGGSNGGAIDESAAKVAITSLLNVQLKAYSDNDPSSFYATYSPNARNGCPFEKFSRQFRTKQLTTAGKKITLANPSFSFRGQGQTVADVHFTVNVANSGSDASGVFVALAGKWFEDDLSC